MKRTFALDLIDEVLGSHELPLLQGISKEILSKLEKAGMLPPPYYFDNEREEGHIMHCIWEPEDA